MKLTVELPCVYSEETLRQDSESAKEDGKVRKAEFRLRSAGEEALEKINAANPAAEIIAAQ